MVDIVFAYLCQKCLDRYGFDPDYDCEKGHGCAMVSCFDGEAIAYARLLVFERNSNAKQLYDLRSVKIDEMIAESEKYRNETGNKHNLCRTGRHKDCTDMKLVCADECHETENHGK